MCVLHGKRLADFRYYNQAPDDLLLERGRGVSKACMSRGIRIASHRRGREVERFALLINWSKTSTVIICRFPASQGFPAY